MMDVINLLLKSQNGTMSIAWRETPEPPSPQAVFILKLDKATLKSIPEYPSCQYRIGTIQTQFVDLVLVLLNLNKQIYGCWLNHHPIDDYGSPLFALAKQPEIHVALYNKIKKPERIISCINDLYLTPLIDMLSCRKPWSMYAFDEAKRDYFFSTQDAEELWRKLSEN
jgi:hypothetical protein